MTSATPGVNGPPADPAEFLAAAGLNRLHVFAIADLPSAWQTALAIQDDERQLLLLGHAGRHLWDCLQQQVVAGDDPIDDYTRATVDACFSRFFPDSHYRLLYPGSDGHCAIGLQALGERAGWHHASPFMVGVDRHWGSWFAYRAVVLTAGNFAVSATPDPGSDTQRHPCLDCHAQPCIAACPADACATPFRLDACCNERLSTASPCATGCLARLACPLGSAHRYSDAQLQHSYGRSLRMLENWRGIR